MIPTFDFINVINRIIRASLVALGNPITILTAVAVAATSYVSTITDYFKQIRLSNLLDFAGVDFGESWWNSDFTQCVAYCLDYTTLCDILFTVIDYGFGICYVVITFFVSFFTAFWAYKVAVAIRQSIKDLT